MAVGNTPYDIQAKSGARARRNAGKINRPANALAVLGSPGANLFLAGPSGGGSGAPIFRGLVTADLNSLFSAGNQILYSTAAGVAAILAAPSPNQSLQSDGSGNIVWGLVTPTITPLKITANGMLVIPITVEYISAVCIAAGPVNGTSLSYNWNQGVGIHGFTLLNYLELVAPTGGRLTSLSFDNLAVVGEAGIVIGASVNIINVTTLAFPALVGIVGPLTLNSLTAATSISMPNLVFCGAVSLNLPGAGITSLSFPSLKYIGGSFTLVTGYCTTVSLPSLESVGGVFTISANSSMTTLDLSSHKRSQGITVTGCSALTSLSVPNTVICGNSGFLAGSCTNLVTLTLGTVGVTQAILGPVTATTCKLNQATVDGILTLLVSLDGTGGTTLYPTSQVVNLSGGTSAAPTFTGTTVNPPVGATFVGVTTTCTVSWTGHGYSTGDLLTVAGLLTLTNANGTFQITVQNANQFTYTIVSQTGTATGVTGATVKKAGNTTEGFYEKQRLIVRGNTVTTN